MNSIITKEEFDIVYNKYKAGKFIHFFYDYFNDIINKNKKYLTKYLLIILTVTFFLGFFSTMFNFSKIIIGIPTFIFAVLLVLIIIPNIIARKLNDLRIKRIYKELGITYDDYVYYTNMYYPKTL
jgi:hypothetical protein